MDRVLTMPGGSLLLAGRSGVGRRTAVTLVSHMQQMELHTPKISRGYGLKQFKNDLKNVSCTSDKIFCTLYSDIYVDIFVFLTAILLTSMSVVIADYMCTFIICNYMESLIGNHIKAK